MNKLNLFVCVLNVCKCESNITVYCGLVVYCMLYKWDKSLDLCLIDDKNR